MMCGDMSQFDFTIFINKYFSPEDLPFVLLGVVNSLSLQL